VCVCVAYVCICVCCSAVVVVVRQPADPSKDRRPLTTYHWNVAVAEQQVRRYPVYVAALVQRLKLHIPIVVWRMWYITICGWEISPNCYFYMFQVKYNRVRRSDVVIVMLLKSLLIFKLFRVLFLKSREWYWTLFISRSFLLFLKNNYVHKDP